MARHTVSLGYTGGVQTVTIPSTYAGGFQFDIRGAQGGNGGNSDGGVAGNGGRVTGSWTPNVGDTINVYVGGQGVAGTNSTASGTTGAYGYHNGGNGAAPEGSSATAGSGGSGGGSSSILDGATFIAEAGGGGGGGGGQTNSGTNTGGAGGSGANAGGNGGAGVNNSLGGNVGGGGAGGAAGGGGGTAGTTGGQAGSNQAAGVGGAGGSSTAGSGPNAGTGGGGGGGGTTGGGGGGGSGANSAAGGGGGGASTAAAAAAALFFDGYQAGNGAASVSWQVAPTVVTPSVAGTTTSTPTVTATYQSADGAPIQAYRVVVYSATQTMPAAPALPSGVTPLYDSGIVFTTSSAISQVTSSLPNGSTTAYIAAEDSAGSDSLWSAWAGETWTQNAPVPQAPEVIVTPLTSLARTRLKINSVDNLASAAAASFETGVGGWGAANTLMATPAQSTAHALDGTHSLALAPVSGGTTGTVPAASTATGTGGYKVEGGASYVVVGAFMAGTTLRGTRAAVVFYDSTGAYITTTSAPVVTDATAYWSFSVAEFTAPANAAFATLYAFVLSPNMLTANDASFEGGVGGWTPTNCSIAQSTAHALNGTHSLAMTCNGTSPSYLGSTAYSVVAGATYTVIGSFLAGSTPRQVQWGVNWLDSNHNSITTVNGSIYADNAAGWTQAEITVVAPANAAYIIIYPNVLGAANGEIHYLDCVGLFAKVVPGQRFPNDSVVETQWAGINPNLVKNPDFEQDTTGWGANAGSIALATGQSYTGLHSLAYTTANPFTNLGYCDLFTDQIPITIGQTYTASMWVFSATGFTAEAAIEWDGNPSSSTTVIQAPNVNVPANTWTRLSVTSVAPATVNGGNPTAWARPGLAVTAAGNAQVIYVDAVKFEVGSVATQFVPPSYSNLIVNPNAVTNAAQWIRNDNGANPTIANPVGALSGRSMLVPPNSVGVRSPLGYDGQWIAAQGGRTYTFSAYVMADTPGTVQISIGSRDAAGTTLSTTSNTPSIAAADTWQRITVTKTVEVNCELLVLNVVPTPGTSGNWYMSNLQLDTGFQANPYVDGSAIGGSWDAATNLLSAAAASFEDGSVGGVAGVNGTTANSTAQAYDGTHSLLYTATSAQAAGNAGTQLGFTAYVPGATYTYSVWVYIPASGGIAGGVRLSVQVTAGTNTEIGSTSAIATTGSWCRLSVNFTVPTNATGTLFCYVLNAATCANGQIFYIDAEQLEPRSYATFYGEAATANASSSTYTYPWDIVGDTHYLDEVGLFAGDTLGYQLQVLADQPLGYWPMTDPVASVTAVNAVGSGSAAAGGTIAFGQAGPIASDPSQTGVSFDGSTGRLSLTSPLTDATQWTVECWARTSAATTNPTAISFGIPASWPNQSMLLYIGDGGSGGAVRVYWEPNGIPGGPQSATSVADGKWHHVAVTLTRTGAMTLYVDGVVAATSTVVGGSFTPTSFSFGATNNNGTWAQFYGGALAHGAVYGVPLSAARIAAHYNAGINTAGSIVQKWSAGGVEPNYFTVQRSLDGGTTWTTVHGGSQITYPGGSVTFDDIGAPREQSVSYRVQSVQLVSGNTFASPWSAVRTTNLPSDGNDWLMCSANHALSAPITYEGPNISALSHEDQAVYYPEGRPDAVVFHGTIHDEQFASGMGSQLLKFAFANDAAWNNFVAMRATQQPLLLKSVYGDTGREQWWVVLGADAGTTRFGGGDKGFSGSGVTQQIRTVQIAAYQVKEPA